MSEGKKFYFLARQSDEREGCRQFGMGQLRRWYSERSGASLETERPDRYETSDPGVAFSSAILDVPTNKLVSQFSFVENVNGRFYSLPNKQKLHLELHSLFANTFSISIIVMVVFFYLFS